ncbi:conjugal transfer protein [Streptococcus mutans]|nr:conjugal transfer protein [Streptococcus mutans]
MINMSITEWLLCPICKSKTRIKLRKNTELRNFPLYCPKCKLETLVNIKELKTTIIKEPDAKMQSR